MRRGVEIIQARRFLGVVVTKVALDLGSTTGVAWECEGDDLKTSPRIRSYLLTSRSDHVGHAEAVGGITHILNDLEPLEVLIEDVRGHTGTKAAHRYGAIVGAVSRWCVSRGRPLWGIKPSVLKRYAAGNGGADKKDMTTAVIRRLRLRGIIHQPLMSHDEADALAVLMWAQENPVGERSRKHLLIAGQA
jgi:Holliday junction resolvasome RuvABC endonuclease subunit